MGYSVWDVIKRFMIGWLIAGLALVVISCIRYQDYIIAAFTNNTMTWIYAIMPVVIIFGAIIYMIRSVFR